MLNSYKWFVKVLIFEQKHISVQVPSIGIGYFYKNILKIKIIFVVEYNNLCNNLDKMMIQFREVLPL